MNELRSGRPRHEQISAWLRDEIDAESFAPDERLPSESDLCRRFDVSRVTVRRALQTLEADGLVYRRQGLGTFVRDQRVHQGLLRLTDFAQDMERAGLKPSSQALWAGEEPCPEGVAPWMDQEPGSPVFRVDRLRLGNGDPVALDRTWLPLPYGRLLEDHDLAGDTLYGILEEEYGIPILSGRYRISAAVADAEVAGRLGVAEGAPLLFVERLSRTAGDRPVYVQHRFYRNDRVAHELELDRNADDLGSDGSSAEGLPLRDFQVVCRGNC